MTLGYPTGQGKSLGYAQLISFATETISAASWSAGEVTFTTGSAHGVSVGATFRITGMTPDGYNGTFVAIAGTTGSTLVAALETDPGTATVMGSLAASLSAATPLPAPEGTTHAVIAVSAAGIRYRDDGVVPTAGLGLPIAQNEIFTFAGNMKNIQFIAQSGSPVLDILFYK